MKNYLKGNPWAEVYAFLWYNSDEIWNFTQKDWDDKAKEFYDAGVTTAITFSVTHYRMSYYPYWAEINECLRKMVKACHKYGIKVVEHHSSHLTSRLDTEHGWKRFEENQRVRNGKYDDWKKIYPYLTCSRTVEGKKIDDMCQIDGRTGKIADNCYGTYSLCFNNPDYREVYFNYMKDVVATGIDGIMNDDIQYFGDENACACEHCRKLFKEQTGYELPSPDKWGEFFENYENPAYIAWKKFKFDSTSRMYRDLTKLYNDLGLNLLRPNYSSGVLMNNRSYYSFERCMDQWSAIMQENCFSFIDKYSYLTYYPEAVHRYAAGHRYGVPAMSIFYPEAQDSVYLTWALAKSWGQLFSGTYEGRTASEIEKNYRAFEQDNMRYYTAPDKISDVSFYFSMKTRDFVKNAEAKMFKFVAGIQAAYVSGLGVDMVFEDDSVEELLKHGTVVMSYVAMADDGELDRLAEFVRLGGRLIILGDFASLNADGSCRTQKEIEAKFRVAFEKDKAVKCGDGEIWSMTFESAEEEYQYGAWSDHWAENVGGVASQVSKWKMQNEGTGAVLKSIVRQPKIKIESANDRAVVTGYKVDGALALHIVNLADTIPDEPCKVAHSDTVKNFTPDGDKLPESKLRVKIPQGMDAKTAVLKSPEISDEIELAMKVCEGAAEIIVPGDIFSGYALVTVE